MNGSIECLSGAAEGSDTPKILLEAAYICKAGARVLKESILWHKTKCQEHLEEELRSFASFYLLRRNGSRPCVAMLYTLSLVAFVLAILLSSGSEIAS